MISQQGNRIALTELDAGVQFDLNGDGTPEQVSWTVPDSDAAFLVLDRNGNGLIDNGLELFGNFTKQPLSGSRNGFRALAVFDEEEQGGNADGTISREDDVFTSLGLWFDYNKDGHSQAEELMSLSATPIRAIPTSYSTNRRVDRFGNEFRYWTKLQADESNWFAVDVFLLIRPASAR